MYLYVAKLKEEVYVNKILKTLCEDLGFSYKYLILKSHEIRKASGKKNPFPYEYKGYTIDKLELTEKTLRL